MSILRRALFIFIVSSIACTGSSSGQGIGTEDGMFTYQLRDPGQPSMIVYIWGDVGNAGIWRVNRDVDFIELLSAARPVGVGVERARQRQRVSIRVYRIIDGDRSMIYNQQLNEILEEGLSLPDLTDEDVLEVRTRERRGRLEQFRLITGVLGSAASLVLLLLRVTGGR